MTAPEEFSKLLSVIEKLLGPDGCPWDKEQTPMSLRTTLLEECHELIEAISEDNDEKILEELGDLFFNTLFLTFVAENENRFTKEELLETIQEKLQRRHPHVFQKMSIKDLGQLYEMWERIKKEEPGKEDRVSVLDGIPKGLPAMARAQKIQFKMRKAGYPPLPRMDDSRTKEEEAGRQLWDFCSAMIDEKVDAEQALLSEVSLQEQVFRQWEQMQKKSLSNDE